MWKNSQTHVTMVFMREGNKKKTASQVQDKILVKTEELIVPTCFHRKRFGLQACLSERGRLKEKKLDDYFL